MDRSRANDTLDRLMCWSWWDGFERPHRSDAQSPLRSVFRVLGACRWRDLLVDRGVLGAPPEVFELLAATVGAAA